MLREGDQLDRARPGFGLHLYLLTSENPCDDEEQMATAFGPPGRQMPASRRMSPRSLRAKARVDPAVDEQPAPVWKRFERKGPAGAHTPRRDPKS